MCTHLCTLDIDVHLGENNAFVVPLGERGVLGLERYTLSAPVDFQFFNFFFSEKKMASEAYLDLSATHFLHLLIIVKNKIEKSKTKRGNVCSAQIHHTFPLFFQNVFKKGEQKGGKYDGFERSNLSATHFLHLSIIVKKKHS